LFVFAGRCINATLSCAVTTNAINFSTISCRSMLSTIIASQIPIRALVKYRHVAGTFDQIINFTIISVTCCFGAYV
jgi:hypothetical protein